MMKGMFMKSTKVKGNKRGGKGGKGWNKRRQFNQDDRLENLQVHGNGMMPLPTKSWHRLHAACILGNVSEAKRVLADHITPQNRTKALQYIDTDGLSAWHFAALAGGVELMAWLAKAMSENKVSLTKTTSRGQTVVHLAAEQGHIEALQWLLSEQCDAFQEMRKIAKASVTNRGLSALHLAAINGHLGVVDYLVKPGIVGAVLGRDPEIDRRVVQISERTGHHDVAVFLITAFASLFSETMRNHINGVEEQTTSWKRDRREARLEKKETRLESNKRNLMNPKLGMKFIAAARSGDLEKMEKIYAKMRESCNLPPETSMVQASNDLTSSSSPLPLSSLAIGALSSGILDSPTSSNQALGSKSATTVNDYSLDALPVSLSPMGKRSMSSPGATTPTAASGGTSTAPSVFDIFGLPHPSEEVHGAGLTKQEVTTIDSSAPTATTSLEERLSMNNNAVSDPVGLSLVKLLIVDKERPSVATYSRAESADLLKKFQLLYPGVSTAAGSGGSGTGSSSNYVSGNGDRLKGIEQREDDFDVEPGSNAMEDKAKLLSQRSTSSISSGTFINSDGEKELLDYNQDLSIFSNNNVSNSSAKMTSSSCDGLEYGDGMQEVPDLSRSSSSSSDEPSPLDWVANNGYTALMEASFEGSAKVCEWLIDRGASLSIRTKRGFSAIQLAVKQGHLDVVKVLSRAHAKKQRKKILKERSKRSANGKQRQLKQEAMSSGLLQLPIGGGGLASSSTMASLIEEEVGEFAGLDVLLPRNQEATLIELALKFEHQDVVEWLLQQQFKEQEKKLLRQEREKNRAQREQFFSKKSEMAPSLKPKAKKTKKDKEKNSIDMGNVVLKASTKSSSTTVNINHAAASSAAASSVSVKKESVRRVSSSKAIEKHDKILSKKSRKQKDEEEWQLLLNWLTEFRLEQWGPGLKEFGFDSLDRIELITESDIDDLGLNRGEKRILLNALSKLKSSPPPILSQQTTTTQIVSSMVETDSRHETSTLSIIASEEEEEEEGGGGVHLSSEQLHHHNHDSDHLHSMHDAPAKLTSYDRNHLLSSNGSSNQYSSGGSDDRICNVNNTTSSMKIDYNIAEDGEFELNDSKHNDSIEGDSSEPLIMARLDSAISDTLPMSNSLSGAKSSQLLGQDGFGGARELSWAELSIGSIVGQGSFGMVRRGKWRGMDVAIKTIKNRVSTQTMSPTSLVKAAGAAVGAMTSIKKGGSGGIEDDIERERKQAMEKAAAELRHEAAMLARVCHHESVVEFVGIVPEKLAVVMKFMSNGSLQSLIYAKPSSASGGGLMAKSQGLPSEYQSIEREIMVVRMAVEATRGLQHLHSEGVIHRDVAARNILVDEHFRVRVADFGFARLKEKGRSNSAGYTSSDMGPIKWSAPEAIRRRRYSEKSDVFSFGVLLYEMLAQCAPWKNYSNMEVVVLVCQGKRMAIPFKSDDDGDDEEEEWWNEYYEGSDGEEEYESEEDGEVDETSVGNNTTNTANLDGEGNPSLQRSSTSASTASSSWHQAQAQCHLSTRVIGPLKLIMKKCWNENPTLRPSLIEVETSLTDLLAKLRSQQLEEEKERLKRKQEISSKSSFDAISKVDKMENDVEYSDDSGDETVSYATADALLVEQTLKNNKSHSKQTKTLASSQISTFSQSLVSNNSQIVGIGNSASDRIGEQGRSTSFANSFNNFNYHENKVDVDEECEGFGFGTTSSAHVSMLTNTDEDNFATSRPLNSLGPLFRPEPLSFPLAPPIPPPATSTTNADIPLPYSDTELDEKSAVFENSLEEDDNYALLPND